VHDRESTMKARQETRRTRALDPMAQEQDRLPPTKISNQTRGNRTQTTRDWKHSQLFSQQSDDSWTDFTAAVVGSQK
jgi:hypothetical protein